jgi:RNA polymerase sigma-70 factor (ECF subfamily)
VVRLLLKGQPAPGAEESARFDAEYRIRVLHWAAERVRDEFSEAAWQAFWRTGVEGQSAENAARDLGLTVGTVYQYKSRVVARIRREIELEGSGWWLVASG